jgi:hypothetical protein
MNTKRIITTIALSFGLAIAAQAQKVEVSVMHELSKKAGKAELYGYHLDEENGLIKMPYLIKEKKSTVELETYSFNLNDLSFASVGVEEVDKEVSEYRSVPTTRRGFTQLLRVKPNPLNGKIKLQLGYLSGGYAGRAYITAFNVEDERNVVTKEGDKFIYLWHKTQKADFVDNSSMHTSGTFGWGYSSIGTGNVAIIGMEKNEPYYTKYAFTIYDVETLSEKLYKSFDLGFSCAPTSVKELPNGNVAILFEPVDPTALPKTKGAERKFNLDPEKYFHYLEINTTGDIVSQTKFKLDGEKTGSNYIDIIPTQNKGELVLIGSRKSDERGAFVMTNPKFMSPTIQAGSPIKPALKPDQVVIIKIKDGKVLYKHTYPASEILTNSQAIGDTKLPDDGVKYLFKDGGLYILSALSTEDGQTLISARRGDNHHVIQVDRTGQIAANYIASTTQDWSTNNEFTVNSSGEIFWIKYDMPSHKDDASSDQKAKALAQRTATISKIDPENKQILNTISLTPPDVTLDEMEPASKVDADTIITLGQGKKREISLSKITLNN